MLLVNGPIDIEALGARFRLYPDANVCERRILFTPQYFDPAELDLICSMICDGFTFLDIGANIGGYALAVAARSGPKARILAIEPNPEIFDRLVFNIAQNPLGRVKAIGCAVTDVDGSVTLFRNSKNHGEASIREMPPDEWATASLTVPGRTLSGLVHDEGIDRIDAMKLDIEGLEDIVLMRFFGKAPPSLWPRLLVVEDAPERWGHDLYAHLGRWGYRLVLTTRMNRAFALG